MFLYDIMPVHNFLVCLLLEFRINLKVYVGKLTGIVCMHYCGIIMTCFSLTCQVKVIICRTVGSVVSVP